MKLTTTNSRDLRMSAVYREWEPVEGSPGVYYRSYGTPRNLECRIQVTMLGGLTLITKEELQSFGLIERMADPAGNVFMDTTWYQVTRVTPMFDADGYLIGYRHALSSVTPELLNEPINPPASYPNLDQV